MRARTAALLLFCALTIGIVPAMADQWNKRTVVTFTTPVQLPGVTLPAGTYVFKLADSLANRNIVQVFTADESHLLATILAIPNYRLEPAPDTIIRFAERPSDQPEALRAWFYPGDNFGQEFVYPKARARELALTVREPVLAAEIKPTEKPAELEKAPVIEITPVTPPATAESRAPFEVTMRPVTPELEPYKAPVPVRELPKTASSLPLIGLTALTALAIAAVLGLLTKRSA